MKLYYSPGSCSLSPHIVAREAGIELELERVDTKAKVTETGRSYWTINPKGYVPALELDDGEILTEGPAIVQYLADSRPDAGLAPGNGTMARYRLQEMLGYINSELHKTYSPLFNPTTTDELRQERKQYLRKRYGVLNELLADRPFLLGAAFTAADAYLFTVTNWARVVELDLAEYPNMLTFQQRIAKRPSVQAALRAEGIGK
jgi:glutathione S-transferase